LKQSTDKEWKEYYEKKAGELERQLKNVASMLPHFLRLGMDGKKKDLVMLSRRAANALKYPRDRDPLTAELKKYPEFAGSVLREEGTGANR